MTEKTQKSEERVIISLKGAGITFESEISPLMAANVLKLCLATDQEVLKNEVESSMSAERISLGEFVHKHEPTSYPEKILAIASYLKEHKGRETFSPEDIRPLFRTIGDVPPANFGRDFRLALGNTWIGTDDQDPNAYYVTGIGLKALKSNFSGESIKKCKTRKRKKNSAVT